ncbi:MAG TPA: tetratricopeptide repeat protein [Planctomycetota bacterium]|nr:tetratricopeptide repeat protein [Planctomycetota bacterium]
MNVRWTLVFAACVAATAVAQDKKDAGKNGKPADKAAEKAAPRPIDRVNRTGGKPSVKGTVTAETCVEVVIRRENNTEERIPVDDVLSVDRGDAPEAYRRGVAAFGAGDYPNAVQLLTRALTENADKAWLGEAANFYLGEASRLSGKHDDAVKAYDAVVAAKGDSRFLAPARLGQARAQIAASRFPDAEKTLNGFLAEAEAKKIPRRHVLKAREMIGKNLEAQNRFGEAVGAYDAVVREAGNLAKDDPGVAERIRTAQRAKASCLIREKKYDEAARLLDGLAADKSPAGEAMALTGRGESLLAQGKFDDARATLARVIGARFHDDHELARAMLLMAKTLLEIDKEGKDASAAKTAQSYLTDLVEQHAASEFSKEARMLKDKR